MAKLSSKCSRNVAFQTKSHRMRKANSGNSSVNILQTVQTQLPRGNNTAGPQPFKEQGLVLVSSPSLLNRYNSRRVYVTCVGVVHFPYPILIIISEQRDIIPYNTHNPKTRIHELWHTPKIHFEGKCQAANPFTTPESISPAQKQHRKNSNKDIHKDPDTIYQIFQQDDPHF